MTKLSQRDDDNPCPPPITMNTPLYTTYDILDYTIILLSNKNVIYRLI